jgi:hypothetical protein
VRAALSSILMTALLVGLTVFSGLTSGSAQTQTPQSIPFERAVFFTSGNIPNVSEADLLLNVPQVKSVHALEAMVGPDINTIIVDKDTIGQLPPDFLDVQAKAGRSIIAINVPFAELWAKAHIDQRQPLAEDVGVWHNPPPPEPFYSALSTSADGAPIWQLRSMQKVLTGSYFEATLWQFLNRAYWGN